MNKALFWDFDGTLVYNSGYIWDDSLHEVLMELGYNIELEKIYQHCSSKSNEMVKIAFSWHTPGIAYTDAVGHIWWDNFHKKCEPFFNHYAISKEDAEKSILHIKKNILSVDSYNLYEDSATVLGKCMELGFRNYILSNNYPELPDIIKDLGLADYFVDYIVSANVGYEKPRFEIFQYARNVAGLPDICYMIGDNPVADIQGGKAAGMKTILVNKDSIFDADYLCKNLSEIPIVLHRFN